MDSSCPRGADVEKGLPADVETTDEAKEEKENRPTGEEERRAAQGHRDAQHVRGSDTQPEMRCAQQQQERQALKAKTMVETEEQRGRRIPGNPGETRRWPGNGPVSRDAGGVHAHAGWRRTDSDKRASMEYAYDKGEDRVRTSICR